MSKFRKKPVVIEAFQMTPQRRNDNQDWPEWLHKAWNKDPGEGALFIASDDPDRQRLVIGTLEGVHRVTWGDWIIRGVKDELYACKPDIFEATYEALETTCEAVVDTECECGVKLSSDTQQLYSDNAVFQRKIDDLEIDLQMANEENADLRRQLAGAWAEARTRIEKLREVLADGLEQPALQKTGSTGK